jgi:hypothetical protein
MCQSNVRNRRFLDCVSSKSPGARAASGEVNHARIFTAEEQAHAHCQVGNLPLAIGTISDWTKKMASR